MVKKPLRDTQFELPKFQGMFFLYYGFSFLPQKYLLMKLLQFFNVYIVLWI